MTLTEIILSVCLAIASGVCKILWQKVSKIESLGDKTKDDLAAYKLHAAETFSTKNDLGKAIEQFSRSIDAVFAKLERIEDKLDQKADKAHS